MSYNSIAYWENWLQGVVDIPITKDGYIFKYCIVNQFTNDGVKHWVCCNSKKKLYSFIKYLIMPSIIFSKTFGLIEGAVYFDVSDYDEVIEILDNSKVEGYEKAIEEFIIWFEKVEKLEEEDADFIVIREFIHNICVEIGFREGLYMDLDLFENISSVGKTLIRDYKENDMLDELEYTLELSKEEIEDLFENIDENKFMLNKITTLLNEKLI